jgi:hypothetical protein
MRHCINGAIFRKLIVELTIIDRVDRAPKDARAGHVSILRNLEEAGHTSHG